MFSSIFNYDNPFWRFVGKLGDLIILNVLWIVCSIPIITAGAATTAVYYVTLKLVKDEEGGTVKSFFRSFKQNFRQSTVIWLILLAVALILWFDWRFVYGINAQPVQKTMLTAAFGCLSFVYLAVLLYVFPIQARFYNSIRRTFINACFMAVRHFPSTIAMLITNIGLLLICFVLVPYLMILVILFGQPLFAFLNSYLMAGIFAKYSPEPLTEDRSEG